MARYNVHDQRLASFSDFRGHQLYLSENIILDDQTTLPPYERKFGLVMQKRMELAQRGLKAGPPRVHNSYTPQGLFLPHSYREQYTQYGVNRYFEACPGLIEHSIISHTTNDECNVDFYPNGRTEFNAAKYNIQFSTQPMVDLAKYQRTENQDGMNDSYNPIVFSRRFRASQDNWVGAPRQNATTLDPSLSYYGRERAQKLLDAIRADEEQNLTKADHLFRMHQYDYDGEEFIQHFHLSRNRKYTWCFPQHISDICRTIPKGNLNPSPNQIGHPWRLTRLPFLVKWLFSYMEFLETIPPPNPIHDIYHLASIVALLFDDNEQTQLIGAIHDLVYSGFLTISTEARNKAAFPEGYFGCWPRRRAIVRREQAEAIMQNEHRDVPPLPDHVRAMVLHGVPYLYRMIQLAYFGYEDYDISASAGAVACVALDRATYFRHPGSRELLALIAYFGLNIDEFIISWDDKNTFLDQFVQCWGLQMTSPCPLPSSDLAEVVDIIYYVDRTPREAGFVTAQHGHPMLFRCAHEPAATTGDCAHCFCMNMYGPKDLSKPISLDNLIIQDELIEIYSEFSAESAYRLKYLITIHNLWEHSVRSRGAALFVTCLLTQAQATLARVHPNPARPPKPEAPLKTFSLAVGGVVQTRQVQLDWPLEIFDTWFQKPCPVVGPVISEIRQHVFEYLAPVLKLSTVIGAPATRHVCSAVFTCGQQTQTYQQMVLVGLPILSNTGMPRAHLRAVVASALDMYPRCVVPTDEVDIGVLHTTVYKSFLELQILHHVLASEENMNDNKAFLPLIGLMEEQLKTLPLEGVQGASDILKFITDTLSMFWGTIKRLLSAVFSTTALNILCAVAPFVMLFNSLANLIIDFRNWQQCSKVNFSLHVANFTLALCMVVSAIQILGKLYNLTSILGQNPDEIEDLTQIQDLVQQVVIEDFGAPGQFLNLDLQSGNIATTVCKLFAIAASLISSATGYGRNFTNNISSLVSSIKAADVVTDTLMDVLADVLDLDPDGQKALATTVSELEQHGDAYLALNTAQWVGAKINEIVAWTNTAAQVIRTINRKSKVSTARLSSLLASVSQRMAQYKQGLVSGRDRPVPMAVWFRSEPGRGKTDFITKHCIPHIAGMFNAKPDVYLLDTGKYYASYQGQKWGFIDEGGARSAISSDNNPMLMMNQILSSAPLILPGAALEEKTQAPCLMGVFIASNMEPSHVNFGLLPEAKQALLTRIDEIEVVDELYNENLPREDQPHRMADYSHLTFKVHSRHTVVSLDADPYYAPFRRNDGFYYLSGEALLKRLSDRIKSNVVRWRQTYTMRRQAPNPPRVLDVDGSLFELPSLEEGLTQADAGEPFVFTIAGKPGVGKTRTLKPKFCAVAVAMGYNPVEATLESKPGTADKNLYILDDQIDFSEKSDQQSLLKFLNARSRNDIVLIITNWGPERGWIDRNLGRSYPYKPFKVLIDGISRRMGLYEKNLQSLFMTTDSSLSLKEINGRHIKLDDAFFNLVLGISDNAYPPLYTQMLDPLPFTQEQADFWFVTPDVQVSPAELFKVRCSSRIRSLIAKYALIVSESSDPFTTVLSIITKHIKELPGAKGYICIGKRRFLIFDGAIYIDSIKDIYHLSIVGGKVVLTDDSTSVQTEVFPELWHAAIDRTVPAAKTSRDMTVFMALRSLLDFDHATTVRTFNSCPIYTRSVEQLRRSLEHAHRMSVTKWKDWLETGCFAACAIGALAILIPTIWRYLKPVYVEEKKWPWDCAACRLGNYCHIMEPMQEEEEVQAKGKTKRGRGAIMKGGRLRIGKRFYFNGVLYYDNDTDFGLKAFNARHTLNLNILNGKHRLHEDKYVVDFKVANIDMRAWMSADGGDWHIEEGGLQAGALDKCIRLRSNVLDTHCNDTDQTAHITMISEEVGVTPAHVYNKVGAVGIASVHGKLNWCYNVSCIYVDLAREIAIVRVWDAERPKAKIQGVRDITDLIVSFDELETAHHAFMLLPHADLAAVEFKCYFHRVRTSEFHIDALKAYHLNVGYLALYSSTVPTVAGDCGAPIFVEIGGKVAFAGVHTAFSLWEGATIFSCVTTELLRHCFHKSTETQANKDLPMLITSRKYDGFEIPIDVDGDMDYKLILPGAFGRLVEKRPAYQFNVTNRARNIGRVDNQMPLDTKFSRLRIHCKELEEVFGLLKQPTLPLAEITYKYPDKLPPDAKGIISAVNLKLSKLSETTTLEPQVITEYQFIMAELGRYYRAKYGVSRVQPLSVKEAFNGVTPASAMDLDTSLGAHCHLLFPGFTKKSQVIEDDGTGTLNWNNTECAHFYRQFVDDQWEAAGENVALLLPGTASAKSELLELDKPWKKRIVIVEDLAAVINQKRLLFAVQEILCQDGPHSAFLLKTYPQIDWHVVATHLKDHPKMMSMDFKDFDHTVPGPFLAAVAHFVIALYGLSPETEPKLINRIKTVFHSIAYRTLLVGEDLILKSDGMNSGMFGTSLIDSIIVLGLLVYAYKKIMDVPLHEVLDCFMDDVVTKHGGDDNVISVDERVANKLTFRAIQGLIKRDCGMTITSSDKDSDDQQYGNIKTVSFLSRSFVDLDGVWFPKLKEASLSGQICYSNSENPQEILSQLYAARGDVLSYGKDKFEQFERAVRKYALENQLEYSPAVYDTYVRNARSAVLRIAPPEREAIIESVPMTSVISKERFVITLPDLPQVDTKAIKAKQSIVDQKLIQTMAQKTMLATLRKVAHESACYEDYVKSPIVQKIVQNPSDFMWLAYTTPVTKEEFKCPNVNDMYWWSALANPAPAVDAQITDSLRICMAVPKDDIPVGIKKHQFLRRRTILTCLFMLIEPDCFEGDTVDCANPWQTILDYSQQLPQVSEVQGLGDPVAVPAAKNVPIPVTDSADSVPRPVMIPKMGLTSALTANIGYFKDLVSFMYQPYFIKTLNISTSTSANTLIGSFDFNPWDSTVVGPQVAKYAQIHKYFVGQLELKFTLATTGMAFGTITAIYVPGPMVPDGIPNFQALQIYGWEDMNVGQAGSFSILMQAASEERFTISKEAILNGTIYGRLYLFARTPIQNSFAQAITLPLQVYGCVTPGSGYGVVDESNQTLNQSFPVPPLEASLVTTDGVYPDPPPDQTAKFTDELNPLDDEYLRLWPPFIPGCGVDSYLNSSGTPLSSHFLVTSISHKGLPWMNFRLNQGTSSTDTKVLYNQGAIGDTPRFSFFQTGDPNDTWPAATQLIEYDWTPLPTSQSVSKVNDSDPQPGTVALAQTYHYISSGGKVKSSSQTVGWIMDNPTIATTTLSLLVRPCATKDPETARYKHQGVFAVPPAVHRPDGADTVSDLVYTKTAYNPSTFNDKKGLTVQADSGWMTSVLMTPATIPIPQGINCTRGFQTDRSDVPADKYRLRFVAPRNIVPTVAAGVTGITMPTNALTAEFEEQCKQFITASSNVKSLIYTLVNQAGNRELQFCVNTLGVWIDGQPQMKYSVFDSNFKGGSYTVQTSPKTFPLTQVPLMSQWKSRQGTPPAVALPQAGTTQSFLAALAGGILGGVGQGISGALQYDLNKTKVEQGQQQITNQKDLTLAQFEMTRQLTMAQQALDQTMLLERLDWNREQIGMQQGFSLGMNLLNNQNYGLAAIRDMMPPGTGFQYAARRGPAWNEWIYGGHNNSETGDSDSSMQTRLDNLRNVDTTSDIYAEIRRDTDDPPPLNPKAPEFTPGASRHLTVADSRGNQHDFAEVQSALSAISV